MSIFLGVLAFKIHRQPQTNTAAQPYQQVQWMQAWPETLQRPRPVSYTHLDVYKRQIIISTTNVSQLTHIHYPLLRDD